MRRLSLIVCMTLFGVASVFGCESEDKKLTPSQLDESCERTSDCASDLVCKAGTCRSADSNVKVNANQCKPIQCEAAADCCAVDFEPSASCSSYRAQCDSDPTIYASSCALADGPTCKCDSARYACEENFCKNIECTTAADCCADFTPASICAGYASDCALDPTLYDYECTYAKGPNCVCDAGNFACTANQCTSQVTCTTDTDCSFGVCSTAGACVICEEDNDCSTYGADYKCNGNSCVRPECDTDSDCAAYSQCQDDKTCKKVGCTTDRECMITENSYLAICDKDGGDVPTCKVACEHDAQCATTASPLGQCVSGVCQDPGCETDEECRAVLRTDPLMNASLYPGVHAVCVTASK